MTVIFPRARSTSRPLRLFWRAPRISTQPASGGSTGTATRFSSATFEPTNDYPRWRRSSQIVRRESVSSRTDVRDLAQGYGIRFDLSSAIASIARSLASLGMTKLGRDDDYRPRRAASFSRNFNNRSGTTPPSDSKNLAWSSTSFFHSSGLTARSSSRFLREKFFISAISTSSFRGTWPMGDSLAPPEFSQRSMIHLSTRMLSPKPGQRNFPSELLRNQFTLKMSGGLVRRFPISSQWRKY